jgi:hypothetical protein
MVIRDGNADVLCFDFTALSRAIALADLRTKLKR